MILGIDAANIRWGGGVTHLVEILRSANPPEYGFTKVILWSGEDTLNKVGDRPWLIKAREPMLNKKLLYRIFWQKYQLSKLAYKLKCDVLYVPGGTYSGGFHPAVTMSRNLLPFELHELFRFGWSLATIKLLILRLLQSKSYRHAEGLIFLNRYAQNVIMSVIKKTKAKTAIIPHGLNFRFVMSPKDQKSIDAYDSENPYRILYVSTVDMFKHQCEVAEAIALLRKKGYPIILNLVGGAYPAALKRLRLSIKRLDPKAEFIHYQGEIPYQELHEQYMAADLGLFASSCENMPNILIELMASGLPIACSNSGPMPEVLGDAGIYFNPESSLEIRDALKNLLDSPELRSSLSSKSFEKAKKYSWSLCADKTFHFLAEVAQSAD